MTVFLVYFKYLKNYIGGGGMSSPQIQNALQHEEIAGKQYNPPYRCYKKRTLGNC